MLAPIRDLAVGAGTAGTCRGLGTKEMLAFAPRAAASLREVTSGEAITATGAGTLRVGLVSFCSRILALAALALVTGTLGAMKAASFLGVRVAAGGGAGGGPVFLGGELVMGWGAQF